MPNKLITIVVAVITILIITEMVRRRKMLEKYAILWVAVGLGTLLLTIFPGILDFFSSLVGIQVSSNLLFTLYVILILAICLQLSWELSSTEDKVRSLAEEVALLRNTVESNESYTAEIDYDAAGTEPPTTLNDNNSCAS